MINSRDVLNVKNMGNFMKGTIISQFQIQCVVKKPSSVDFPDDYQVYQTILVAQDQEIYLLNFFS